MKKTILLLLFFAYSFHAFGQLGLGNALLKAKSQLKKSVQSTIGQATTDSSGVPRNSPLKKNNGMVNPTQAEIDSANAEFNLRLAEDSYKTYDFKHAYDSYRAAEKHCPTYQSLKFHKHFGRILQQRETFIPFQVDDDKGLERDDETLWHFDKVLQIDSTDQETWFYKGELCSYKVTEALHQIKNILYRRKHALSPTKDYTKGYIDTLDRKTEEDLKDPKARKNKYQEMGEIAYKKAIKFGNPNANAPLKVLDSIIARGENYKDEPKEKDKWHPGYENLYGSIEEKEYQEALSEDNKNEFLCRHIGFKQYYTNNLSLFLETNDQFSVMDVKYTKQPDGGLKEVKTMDRHNIPTFGGGPIPKIITTYNFDKNMRISSVTITGDLYFLTDLFMYYWPKGGIGWYYNEHLKTGVIGTNHYMGDLITFKWVGVIPYIIITQEPGVPLYYTQLKRQNQ
jgi:hypothetical protein